MPVFASEAYPARPLPPALANRVDPSGLLRGLRRHWMLALTLGLICAGGAAALAWKLMPAEYTAKALLLARAAPPRVLSFAGQNPNEFKTFQKTQEILLKSQSVLTTALSSPKIAGLESVKAEIDPITWLESSLRVQFRGEIMTVQLSGSRRGDLRDVVNEVVDTYLNNVVNVDRFNRRKELENLRTTLAMYKQQLSEQRKTHDKLAQMAAGNEETRNVLHRLAMEQEGMVVNDLYRAKSELKKAEIEYQMAQAQHSRPLDQASFDQQVAARVAADEQVQKLRARINALQGAIDDGRHTIRKRGTDPVVQKARRELADANAELARIEPLVREYAQKQVLAATSGTRELASIKDRLDFYGNYVAHLEEQAKQLSQTSKQINRKATELADLESQMKGLEKTIEQIQERVNTLSVDLEAPMRVSLIEHASLPRSPDMKRQLLLTAGVSGGTFLLVLLGISYLEYRIRRIDSPDAVAQGLGMRLVGALPATPARARFALPGRQAAALQEAYWRSRLNESVNAIRTLLLRQSQEVRLQAVLVTSASVGEGKTSLACHLATSLARAGRKTLLLDCDLRNPTAHRVFDLPLEPGMCEVLRGQVPLDEISHPIALGELRMITAGRCDLQALQVLGMDYMGEVMARLRQQYDFIIIDTPPVLPVADPLLIGQHVDAALFSILRDVSRAHKVHTAAERLGALGVRILGAVVAGTPLETHKSEYYYTAAYVGAGADSDASGPKSGDFGYREK
jgi:capsular exopolysaccharide synthesis family protein